LLTVEPGAPAQRGAENEAEGKFHHLPPAHPLHLRRPEGKPQTATTEANGASQATPQGKAEGNVEGCFGAALPEEGQQGDGCQQ